jgi:TonB family protein
MRLLAGPQADIEHAIDGCGMNLDANLAGARKRVGHLLVGEDLGCTESMNDTTEKNRSKKSSLADAVYFPEGDFFVSVEVARNELPAHLEEPKVKFWIAENGEIVDAEIVHSSGSAELDERILHQVVSLKFSPSHHKCRIEETIPVDIQ